MERKKKLFFSLFALWVAYKTGMFQTDNEYYYVYYDSLQTVTEKIKN